jgi:hypothetical protein
VGGVSMMSIVIFLWILEKIQKIYNFWQITNYLSLTT